MMKSDWPVKGVSRIKLLQNYMRETEYAQNHGDMSTLDTKYADYPKESRLDALINTLIVENREEIEDEYSKTMAKVLDGFINMPANGKYKGAENEGVITDLCEKEDFKKVFVNADEYMSDHFFRDKDAHAWDGMLDGAHLRYQRTIKDDGTMRVLLLRTDNYCEHDRIYKAYIRDADYGFDSVNQDYYSYPIQPRLFTLCHSAREFSI